MIFKEIQKFRQPWVWVLLIAIALITIGVFGFGIYQQIFRGIKFGNHPMSDTGLIIAFCLVFLLNAGLIMLFALSRLTIVNDKNGIEYNIDRNTKGFRIDELSVKD